MFQLNSVSNLAFMRKIIGKVTSPTAAEIFLNNFRKPNHKYPTNFSTSNYSIPQFLFSKSKYRISIRGPTLLKNIPANSEKIQESVIAF